ncbi:RNA polymerase Rpb4-domain-containing protein [Lasiosphaeria miniovina]|uniref:DNA-directed RNA polymerase III subunit RPC9 n=1 Tax=Lasiosphaeria miniovina TaxID=1954250 RepID=A0AA39ZZC7_9PEZI|nr:RNA polymerase Rpb4-domain-containing protein [Lasiosphaeria miniovina]KAK0706451.1 RNA polymerase Rpb4-domain-containing protein [Lasiosphaeria miniovina]
MKILETQNGLLSNYEVYQHIVNQQTRNKAQKRRVPGNVATLMTEVVTYLREKPGPLERQEETHAYSPSSVSQLLEKLRDANLRSELAKGEVLSILNLRPTSSALLSTAIEDMEERFSEDEQNKIVEIIIEVLGRDEPAALDERDGDEQDGDTMQSIENGV